MVGFGMKKFILLFFGLSICSASAGELNILPQFVDGLGYTDVNISILDMSRIVCPDADIGLLAYSKEKEIEIIKQGHNAFVKVLPTQVTTEQNGELVTSLERKAFPRELYVECSGQVYNLILTPKGVPAQTIFLKSTVKKMEDALEFETAANYETVMSSLVKSIYVGLPPSGYEIKLFDFEKDFAEIKIKGNKQYLGARYTVYEFIVEAKQSVNLHEGLFTGLIKNPVSISIVDTVVMANKTTRLFIIALKG